MNSTTDVGTDMSKKADIIVTEIFDSELLGEGILPTMRHAKMHLLKAIFCLSRSLILMHLGARKSQKTTCETTATLKSCLAD